MKEKKISFKDLNWFLKFITITSTIFAIILIINILYAAYELIFFY